MAPGLAGAGVGLPHVLRQKGSGGSMRASGSGLPDPDARIDPESGSRPAFCPGMAARVRAPHPANASRQSGATTKFAEEPKSVKDYRFVRGYPAKTGVKSSQSGNSSH